MKRIYSTLLTALLVLAASLKAQAQLATTITWDIPGSVEIYVGGTSDACKVTIPEGATEYVATIANTWGSTYVGATEGYAIKKGEVTETGQELTISPYSKKVIINMQECNGKTVHITASKIVYDAQFELNVINGRDAILCQLDGTDRKVKLQTGVQTVAYSSEFEQRVFFSAKTEGSENPYLLQDGEAVEWKNFYGTLGNNDGFPLHDGTRFEIKYCETPDEAEETSPVVTLNFADEKAREALTMIFNITQFTAIHERESFETKKGDNVRFVFNTKEFDVTVNGEAVVASENETTPLVLTINEDLTVNISATDRQYGNTTVTLWANDIDELVLHEGSINGPVVDYENIACTGSSEYKFGLTKEAKTVMLSTYTITVSAKNPKVYVSAADGYWIESSEYKDGSDYTPTTVATEGYILKVLSQKFTLDKRLVVYLSTDGVKATPDNVILRDNNHQTYTLSEGYNEFIFDSDYSHSFTASVLANGPTEPAFSYFCNMREISVAADTQQRTAELTGDAILHLFAGHATPKCRTITANIATDASETVILADHFTPLTVENPTTTMFEGCEVSVTPGENNYLLDGTRPEYDGLTHTFAVSADHCITITPATGIESINADSAAPTFHNIAGQRVSKPLKGLYIHNGKKLIIK